VSEFLFEKFSFILFLIKILFYYYYFVIIIIITYYYYFIIILFLLTLLLTSLLTYIITYCQECSLEKFCHLKVGLCISIFLPLTEFFT